MFEPADGAILIEALQSDVGTIASVTYTPVAPEVLDKLEWATDLPAEAVITVDGDTLTLTVDSFDFLFPFETIKYLIGLEVFECFRWSDLPDEAEQVIEYRPAPVNLKTYSLAVTATTDLSTETANYTIQVRANYDTGKLLLVEAVNARRS